MNGLINMKKLTDFDKILYLTDRITVEKVYPLSIMEGFETVGTHPWYKYER